MEEVILRDRDVCLTFNHAHFTETIALMFLKKYHIQYNIEMAYAECVTFHLAHFTDTIV